MSILGAGQLGYVALKALGALEYQLSYWTRTPKAIPCATSIHETSGLKSMLKQTDILINLLPLTPETNRLLNKETLSDSRSKIYQIFTRRGS